MVSCTHCGVSNRDGRKFCSACGGSLASGCSACGGPLEAGDRFCGECGAAVTATTPAGAAGTAAPVAERRLVSVLFADLVGFTAASAGRDAEDTRELLSRYFDTSRRLIELYGGTVEKFIGDAVMAVWVRRRRRRTTPSGQCEPDSTSSPPCPRSATSSACRDSAPAPGS